METKETEIFTEQELEAILAKNVVKVMAITDLNTFQAKCLVMDMMKQVAGLPTKY